MGDVVLQQLALHPHKNLAVLGELFCFIIYHNHSFKFNFSKQSVLKVTCVTRPSVIDDMAASSATANHSS